MYSDKQRIATYIQASIDEMELIEKMAQPINKPEDAGLKDLQDYPYALRGYGAHPDTMRDLLTKAIDTIEALGAE